MSGRLIFDLSGDASIENFGMQIEKEAAVRLQKATKEDNQWQFGYYTALLDVLMGVRQVTFAKDPLRKEENIQGKIFGIKRLIGDIELMVEDLRLTIIKEELDKKGAKDK